MTDYHPLIARAVAGLVKNTGAARRALYERARAALIAQLRGVQPALSESEITKERLALEEAIRKVEAESARKGLGEPRSERRSEAKIERRSAAKLDRPRSPETATPRPTPELAPPKPASETESLRESGALSLSAAAMALRRGRASLSGGETTRTHQKEGRHSEPSTDPARRDEERAKSAEPRLAARLTARSRILQARTSSVVRSGFRSFRSVINEADELGAASAKAAQSARETRNSYVPLARAPTIRPRPQAEDLDAPSSLEPQYEPQFDEEEFEDLDTGPSDQHRLEPPYDLPKTLPPPAPRSGRPQPPPVTGHEEEEEYQQPRPRRSYRGLAKLAVLLVILAGAGVTASWQWPRIVTIYQSLVRANPHPPNQPGQATATQTKIPGRVPQEQTPGEAAAPGSQSVPEVAQHAVLYEADPNDPQGKRFPGSVTWRTETVSPGPGLAPELAVRAEISIPERHMTVTWSLRRNTDKALPASHTIEIMFNLPSDFPGGGIANVPGILMKDSEAVRGTPLAGLAVKVTNGFFLIGLNAAGEDMQRNLELLKNRSWFDILLVYSNGGRAILTMEKGPPGDRAFAEALKAWGQ